MASGEPNRKKWIGILHKILFLGGTIFLAILFGVAVLFPPLRFRALVIPGFFLVIPAVYLSAKLLKRRIRGKSLAFILVSLYTLIYFLLAVSFLFLLINRNIGFSGIAGNAKDTTCGLYKINRQDSSGSQKRLLAENFLGDRLIELLSLKPKAGQHILRYKIKTSGFQEFRLSFDEIFLDEKYSLKTDSANPLILDCGSNIGLSVLYFKNRYPEARIIAFEPAPQTFELLKDNVETNKLRDITLVNKALSDSDGALTFYLREDDSTAGSIYQEDRGRPIDVEMVRLSSYIEEMVDVLKIDVEGAEGLIVNDLISSGKIRHVEQMIIEYHLHLYDRMMPLSEFLGKLEAAGFDYQISSRPKLPFERDAAGFIMIYAYRKVRSSVISPSSEKERPVLQPEGDCELRL
jgi:FkbM family methyltransferase